MREARKKPCTICRHWFRPDPRIGARQRACRKRECQAARRRKTQAGWRGRNPDYFIARRIQARSTVEPEPEPLRFPAPLSKLPWDIAQDQFGVKGADFIGVMGRLHLQHRDGNQLLKNRESSVEISKELFGVDWARYPEIMRQLKQQLMEIKRIAKQGTSQRQPSPEMTSSSASAPPKN